MIAPLLIYGLEFMSEHKIMTNELKEKAIKEYKAALLIPRKKKKKRLKNQHYYYIILLVGLK